MASNKLLDILMGKQNPQVAREPFEWPTTPEQEEKVRKLLDEMDEEVQALETYIDDHYERFTEMRRHLALQFPSMPQSEVDDKAREIMFGRTMCLFCTTEPRTSRFCAPEKYRAPPNIPVYDPVPMASTPRNGSPAPSFRSSSPDSLRSDSSSATTPTSGLGSSFSCSEPENPNQ